MLIFEYVDPSEYDEPTEDLISNYESKNGEYSSLLGKEKSYLREETK